MHVENTVVESSDVLREGNGGYLHPTDTGITEAIAHRAEKERQQNLKVPTSGEGGFQMLGLIMVVGISVVIIVGAVQVYKAFFSAPY